MWPFLLSDPPPGQPGHLWGAVSSGARFPGADAVPAKGCVRAGLGGFRVYRFTGLRVYGSGFRVWDLRFTVQGLAYGIRQTVRQRGDSESKRREERCCDAPQRGRGGKQWKHKKGIHGHASPTSHMSGVAVHPLPAPHLPPLSSSPYASASCAAAHRLDRPTAAQAASQPGKRRGGG